MTDRDEDLPPYSGYYQHGEFLNAIREEGGMAGTGEVADSVGCAHDTAYRRLQKLEEEGFVESRKLGNTLVWTISV